MAEDDPNPTDGAPDMAPPDDVDTDPIQEPTEVESAVASVERAAEAVAATATAVDTPPAASASASTGHVDLPDFAGTEAGDHGDSTGLNLLSDVTLRVKVELGRTRMYVEDVLRLNAESIIELDKAAGDPVDIYVNDRHVARGEVLVLNENFCVRISEIIGTGRAAEV